MNNIDFKNQKIWRRDFDDGHAYSVSISSKNQDDTFNTAYLPLKFAKSLGITKKISNGTIADFSGFLSTNTKGQAVIIVTKVEFKEGGKELPKPTKTEQIGFAIAEESIPF